MTASLLTDRSRLGERLVQRGLVTEAQVAEALRSQAADATHPLLGEVLVTLGHCEAADVLAALAEAHDLPFVAVSPRLCDAKVLDVLPLAFCEARGVLPCFRVRDVLTVAVSEPADVFLVDDLARLTGCRIQRVCSPPGDILATLRTYAPSDSVFISADPLDDAADASLSVTTPPHRDAQALAAAAAQGPVGDWVQHLLRDAVGQRARRVYLEPDARCLRVRYRVGDRLIERERPPQSMHDALVARIKDLAGLDMADVVRPQAGTLTVQTQGRHVAVHVQTLRGRCGESVTLTLSDLPAAPFCLESLGFTVDNLRRLREILTRDRGLLVVAAPPGGGAHTSLRGLLSDLDAERRLVCTVEDPPAPNLRGVDQFEVGPWTPGGFHACLETVGRLGPDVLGVGRLPDRRAADAALGLAQNGCLVVGCLHAEDAAGGIQRLLDLGIPRHAVADALVGVLGQGLVNGICVQCRTSHAVSPDEQRLLAPWAEGLTETQRGVGCPHCGHTGGQGRVALHEVLLPAPALRHAIGRGCTEKRLRHIALETGLIPLAADAVEKARAGLIDLSEALRLRGQAIECDQSRRRQVQ